MTTCAECCQELWGHEERFGLCVTCQRAERERIYDEGELEMTDDDEPGDGADGS